MGGGRDKDGVAIYRRVDGAYVRQVPYKNSLRNRDVEQLLLDAWDGYGSEKLILDRLGLTNKISFENDVSAQTRSVLIIGAAKMASKYGSDVLDDIQYDDKKSGFTSQYTLAHAHIVGNSGAISLNPAQFNRGNDTSRASGNQYSVTSKFHPAGNDDEMTIMHEYAHLLQRKLVKRATSNIYDELNTVDSEQTRRFAFLHDGVFNGHFKGDERRNAIKEMTKLRQQDSNIDAKAEKLTQLEGLTFMSSEVRDQHYQIMKLFQKVGAQTPLDVAMSLTGSASAYASKDWGEAHAECVADVMKNGNKARPISIAYVKEMDRLLGIK